MGLNPELDDHSPAEALADYCARGAHRGPRIRAGRVNELALVRPG